MVSHQDLDHIDEQRRETVTMESLKETIQIMQSKYESVCNERDRLQEESNTEQLIVILVDTPDVEIQTMAALISVMEYMDRELTAKADESGAPYTHDPMRWRIARWFSGRFGLDQG